MYGNFGMNKRILGIIGSVKKMYFVYVSGSAKSGLIAFPIVSI